MTSTPRALAPNAPLAAASVAAGLGAWWGAGLRAGAPALREALADLGRPVFVLQDGGGLAVSSGGTWAPRRADVIHGERVLLGQVPPLLPERLGDPAFRAFYGVRYAYVAGSMAHGISSEALVEALAHAGCLSFFGAAGRSIARIEGAIDRLSSQIPHLPWGINLIHSPQEPVAEMATVELLLRRGVRTVEASAYLDLTLPLLRYRVAGLQAGPEGAVVARNRIVAKVSREEVARRFLSPPPERMLARLLEQGWITPDQAALAARSPVCDDLTVEADSGGHTDNRPLLLLLPRILALRDELQAVHHFPAPVRVGAAGGIGTPHAAAAAFALGAAYVVVGSVHQGCVESGTSDRVRSMLAEAGPTDVTMAPAADMFEMGVKVQVLSRGTLFAARARRLYELWRNHDGLDGLSERDRDDLERTVFRMPLPEAWSRCEDFWARRDPGQLDRARTDGKHRMALLFRSYLGLSSKWALDGEPDRTGDYQVWCGPAMGAFNEWARGGPLERVERRTAGAVARNLLCGAAAVLRAAALRSQGVMVPAEAEGWSAVEDAALLERMAGWKKPADQAVSNVSPILTGEPTTGRWRRTADEPLAIVGIGAMFPKSPELRDFWRLVRAGRDAVTELPASHWSQADYFDPDPKARDKTYVHRGAFLSPWPFDPTEFGIPPGILEATDTSQLLGLVVAGAALRDAGCAPDSVWDRARTSVILGVTGTQELVISLGARLGHPHWRRALEEEGVDEEQAARVVQRISASYVEWQENSFPGLLGNVVAGRIANRFDLGGTNCVLDAACASSLAALHLACLELRSGRADRVLTGGVDALNDIFMHLCFSKTPALSPHGDARPFAAEADGTILGEGLGMVVVRRLDDAIADGDRIYAVIRGIGTSSDGRAKSIYAPVAEGQARALRSAYEDARVAPRTIELLEAHGTGTKAGDAAEFQALTQVYGEDSEDRGWCVLGSVKSQIGHTKAAAGAAGLIKAALALHHKVLPGTLKAERPNPKLDLPSTAFVLGQGPRPWLSPVGHPRRAAVSSFGFGGSDYHVVLEEQVGTRRAPAWDGSVEILPFCAADASTLIQQISTARELLAHAGDGAGDAGPILLARRLRSLAAERRITFNCDSPRRLVVVLGDEQDPIEVLDSALLRLDAEGESAWNDPRGFHHGISKAPGGLAFIFPGQGSQHVGMASELATIFPDLLDAANLPEVRETAALIWGSGTSESADRKLATAALARTERAQPALAIVERGLLTLLRRFSVSPDAVAGHSFGEIVALHAAGRMDWPTCLAVASQRGARMAGDGGDRGGMLVVLAPLGVVEDLLREEGLDLVLANRNTPDQGVLSGARTEIDRAEAACRRRKLSCTRLEVAAAFHSPLVGDAVAAFRQDLQAAAFGVGAIPVISCGDGSVWPAGEEATRDRLAAQISRPVSWVDTVASLEARGIHTYVEVGPRAALTGMVRRILGARPHQALALDGGEGRGALFGLADLLARLAALGHNVQLQAWEESGESAPPRIPRMIVPLSGANWRSPPPVPEPPMRREPRLDRTPAAAAPTLDETTLLALAQAQEGIRALQALQQQAADVHRRFLDGQAELQRSFQALVDGQQRLLGRVLGVELAPMPSQTPAQVPVAAPVSPLPVFTAPISPVSNRPTPAPETRPRAARTVTPPVGLSVLEVLLSVVSETTGYPKDTLGPDMDLEADLGIDSIKRVEILSLLTERIPSAPQVEPEQLGRLRTLRQVADFVGGALVVRPALVPELRRSVASVIDVSAVLAQVVSELTGYPLETLDPKADLEADLGIDSIKRVEILSLLTERVPGLPSVEPEQLARLRTLAQVAAFMTVPAALTPPNAEALQATPVAQPGSANGAPGKAPPRRLVGLYQLTPSPTPIVLPEYRSARVWSWSASRRTEFEAGLVRAGWTLSYSGAIDLLLLDVGAVPGGAGDQAVRDAFFVLQAHGASLAATPGARIAAVLSLDGAFGRSGLPVGSDPVTAGLAGVVKAAAVEWKGVQAFVFDLDPALGIEETANRVSHELTVDGPQERACPATGKRLGLLLGEDEPLIATGRLPIGPGDLVVVSGGARGVTAACVIALARAVPASFLLLGRSPAPEAEAGWLALARDEASVKRALIEHRWGGTPPGPRALGEAAERVLANREAASTLRKLADLGATAIYRAVDVTDAAAVTDAVVEARARFGPVRGLLHGAGLLRDKMIADKIEADWDLVWQTKVHGLRNLLSATGSDELKVLAVFSSVTGRLGRRGQVDYAAANEAIVHLALVEAARRPSCRVAALDWGPWDGGMVSAGLRRQFEREGVSLIGLEQGATHLVRELCQAPSWGVEALVGTLGELGEHLAPPDARVWIPSPAAVGVHHRRLDPQVDSWLLDHRLGGKPVLPVAVALEWLAQAACDAVPGSALLAADDLQVLQGVVLDGPMDLEVHLTAQDPPVHGAFAFLGEIKAAEGRVHVRATLTVGARETALTHRPKPTFGRSTDHGDRPGYGNGNGAIYGHALFHGPTFQVLETTHNSQGGFDATLCSPESPTTLGLDGLPARSLPLLLDGVFQAVILWCRDQRGAPSLPARLGRWEQYVDPPVGSGVRAVGGLTGGSALGPIFDIELMGEDGELVARATGYRCTVSPQLESAFRAAVAHPLAPAVEVPPVSA